MPENWKTYKLKEVAKLSTGFAFKSKNYENFGELRVIRGKNITEGYLRWGDDARYWNHSIEKLEKYLVKENDIVIGMDGSKIGKNRALVRKHDLPTILAQRVARVQVKPELASQKLIWQLINNSPFENYVENVKTGTSIPHISLGQVGDFEITLPPLPEQKAIANILSAIDDKIENNMAMNKTLEDMTMALYKHWFVDFDSIYENTLADYVELNPRLSIKKGEIATYVNMKALPTEGMSVSQVERVVVKGGAKFQNGDTLLARITPCLENGKTAFVDFLDKDEIGFGSTEFLVLRAKKGISKYWVYCLSRDINLVNHAVSCMIGTSGRQRVQNDPFLQYELPKIDKVLMKDFEIKVEPMFQKVKTNTNENQTLTQLRDTLLPKLISGEVRLKEFEKQVSEVL